MSRVAVTGATGMVGRALTAQLLARGDEVIVLARSAQRVTDPAGARVAEFRADPDSPQPELFEGVDAVVHLAGASIGGRWTKPKKRAIFDSRVLGARAIVASLSRCRLRPKVLVSASAVGYYGSRGDEKLDELAAPGDGFLAHLCVEWEREAAAASELGMRVVCLRQGIVLARGGALAQMLPVFKLGLGGAFGSGQQWWPWIHLDDDVALFVASIERDEITGPVNAVSPGIVRNADFAKALGAALHRPAVLPAPAFVLRMVLGEFADSLLASQRAIPLRARNVGFEFKHENIGLALLDVFARS